MVIVIQIVSGDRGCFDPTWYAPTVAGLANIEAHLAVACAALPVFWPCLNKTWNTIFVTHEVSVTIDYGQFPALSNDFELQSISSDKNLRPGPAQLPERWEPFVGDETTGLGENETVIESTAAVKPSKKFKSFFERGYYKDSCA